MKKWIVCLIAGLALLMFSTGVASDTAVRCGGVLMSPGEVCEETTGSGDVTSRKTYDDVEKETQAAHRTFVTWGRWAMLGGGAVLTALAIWGIAVQRHRKRNQGPTTADLFFQQQAAQARGPYPAPQQHQPQQSYSPQPYRPQQPFPAPQQPPAGEDFGPGAGDDVTQRLR